MLKEIIKKGPKAIEEALGFNEENLYKRMILSVNWISPEQMPYLFHTAESDDIKEVSPALCQSFDYKLWGKVIPVTYALPWPHANRVKNASEVWKPNKVEAYSKTGIPYTYLTVENNDRRVGQIRMGSTMLDQYLLAAKNSGLVFEINIAEIREDGSRQPIKEYISLIDLPVIDAYQFTTTSPIAKATGAPEIHLPIDISHPDFVGYLSFSEYLKTLRHSAHRTMMTKVANMLIGINPNQIIEGIFDQLVRENVQDMNNAVDNNNGVFVSFRPIYKK